jgi:hypothetical protein
VDLENPLLLTHPPEDTRAVVRGSLMRRIAETGDSYEIDWHRIGYGNAEAVLLLDPFQTVSGR